jgi:hypothetical protein
MRSIRPSSGMRFDRRHDAGMRSIRTNLGMRFDRMPWCRRALDEAIWHASDPWTLNRLVCFPGQHRSPLGIFDLFVDASGADQVNRSCSPPPPPFLVGWLFVCKFCLPANFRVASVFSSLLFFPPLSPPHPLSLLESKVAFFFCYHHGMEQNERRR